MTPERAKVLDGLVNAKHRHRYKLKEGLLSGRVFRLRVCDTPMKDPTRLDECSMVEEWYPIPEGYDGVVRLPKEWAIGVREAIRKRATHKTEGEAVI